MTITLFQYLQASIIGTLANFFSRFLFAEWFTFSQSVIIANYVGMIIVFTLSYKYAFGVDRFRWVMFFKFILVAHIGLLVVFLTASLTHMIVYYLVDSFPMSYVSNLINQCKGWGLYIFDISALLDGFCHGVGIVTGFFVNYFGHKIYSFRRRSHVC